MGKTASKAQLAIEQNRVEELAAQIRAEHPSITEEELQEAIESLQSGTISIDDQDVDDPENTIIDEIPENGDQDPNLETSNDQSKHEADTKLNPCTQKKAKQTARRNRFASFRTATEYQEYIQSMSADSIANQQMEHKITDRAPKETFCGEIEDKSQISKESNQYEEGILNGQVAAVSTGVFMEQKLLGNPIKIGNLQKSNERERNLKQAQNSINEVPNCKMKQDKNNGENKDEPITNEDEIKFNDEQDQSEKIDPPEKKNTKCRMPSEQCSTTLSDISELSQEENLPVDTAMGKGTGQTENPQNRTENVDQASTDKEEATEKLNVDLTEVRLASVDKSESNTKEKEKSDNPEKLHSPKMLSRDPIMAVHFKEFLDMLKPWKKRPGRILSCGEVVDDISESNHDSVGVEEGEEDKKGCKATENMLANIISLNLRESDIQDEVAAGNMEALGYLMTKVKEIPEAPACSQGNKEGMLCENGQILKEVESSEAIEGFQNPEYDIRAGRKLVKGDNDPVVCKGNAKTESVFEDEDIDSNEELFLQRKIHQRFEDTLEEEEAQLILKKLAAAGRNDDDDISSDSSREEDNIEEFAGQDDSSNGFLKTIPSIDHSEQSMVGPKTLTLDLSGKTFTLKGNSPSDDEKSREASADKYKKAISKDKDIKWNCSTSSIEDSGIGSSTTSPIRELLGSSGLSSGREFTNSLVTESEVERDGNDKSVHLPENEVIPVCTAGPVEVHPILEEDAESVEAKASEPSISEIWLENDTKGGTLKAAHPAKMSCGVPLEQGYELPEGTDSDSCKSPKESGSSGFWEVQSDGAWSKDSEQNKEGSAAKSSESAISETQVSEAYDTVGDIERSAVNASVYIAMTSKELSNSPDSMESNDGILASQNISTDSETAMGDISESGGSIDSITPEVADQESNITEVSDCNLIDELGIIYDDAAEWGTGLEMMQDEWGIMMSDDEGESEDDDDVFEQDRNKERGKRIKMKDGKLMKSRNVSFHSKNVMVGWKATKLLSAECVPDSEGLEGKLQEASIRMTKLLQEAQEAHRIDSPDVEGAQAKVTLQAYGLKMGDKVIVGGVKSGVLRFCGPTEFASGIWAGIELDEPAGKNDGSVGGVSYFKCSPKHGIFAPVTKISKPGILLNRGGTSPRKPLNYGHVDTSKVTAKVDTGLHRARSARSGSAMPGEENLLEAGERVLVAGQRRGIIRFSGETDFAPGWWYGIELDRPVGKNDGSVNGKRYFTCKPKYGVFAPPSRIQKLSDLPDAGECLDAVAERQRRLSGGTGSGSQPALSTTTAKVRPSTARQQGLFESSSMTPSNIPSTPRRLPKSSGTAGLRRPFSLSNTGGEFRLQEGTSVFCNNELGVIRFMGTVDFAEGIWLGVELRTPKGKNDGSVNGTRFFKCLPNHGLLVRPSKVTVRGINGAKLMGNLETSEADKKDTSY